ncbi:MAG: hypothetical protein NTZ87_02600 [Candidatus Nomurabacteria bacterium]|nr:hypothetical protein [Candidatus Nomurabacteria bacterium]
MEYKSQNIICQNCKKDFTIEPDDFGFYEKIKVPPPTFCPECRLVRRLMWRNEHSLFRRPNSAPGESSTHISIYHPDAKIISYDKEMWWGDKWDPCDYGTDYDFSRPFFEQFKELLKRVPHLTLSDSKSVNARFCNVTVEMKNCYLISAGWASEDSMYCNKIEKCKFTHDSYICFSIELGYENIYCKNSSRLFFSRESEGCLDSYFLYDCRNCSNCILCTNSRNKSYCIENVQYTREEYLKKKDELALNTCLGVEKAKIKFEKLWQEAFHKHLKLINTNNVVGDHVSNSRDCFYVFDINGEAENSKYANWGIQGLKDSYDVGPGCGSSELTYESVSIGVSSNRCFFNATTWYSSNVFYSFMMNNCHYCFGCAEMNGKQYCIFNKQYTKEEYETLVPKIIKQMKEMPYIDKKGNSYGFGEFFPPEISPFAYNETVAQDYFPINEKVAEAKGYLWREYVPNAYKTTIKGKDLPQTIAEVDDSILDEVIECEITKKPFKILEQELSFYKRLDLPLPSIHPDERHNRRLKLRNPMILRKRMCFFGDKEVFTTYLPESEGGPKKVVCTEHYNQEIY